MKVKPLLIHCRTAAGRLALGALLAGTIQWPASAAEDRSAIVGEATLVIGAARVINPAGQTLTVEKGAAIRVGDRIETGIGGHVHLRFVDGGRVSVRPASRLVIENYGHSAGQQALTAIKFRLDEGVVRSITGAWGEAERDRFRLNTPIAAIGVKGTDFIVKAGQGATTASVYSGAILLAPLSVGCQATLGPCLNGNEKLLSEDMKGQMLELGRQHASARLVPIETLARARTDASTGDTSARSERTTQAEAAHGGVGIDKTMVSEALGATAAANLPPIPEQLVWGRWSTPLEGDHFSQTFEEALKNREITVGNGPYVLFRDTATAGPAQLEGAANFRLAASAASFTGVDRTVEAARVEAGTLNVDFTRASFATQLSVSSPRLGADTIRSSGAVLDSGIFQSREGNAFVAGALSKDGKEAGYFFEKVLPAGGLTGITLWGR